MKKFKLVCLLLLVFINSFCLIAEPANNEIIYDHHKPAKGYIFLKRKEQFLKIDVLANLNRINECLNTFSHEEFPGTFLHYAVANDNFELSKFLLNNGANPDMQTNDIDRDTILHFATNADKSEKLVELLLQYKANPNIANRENLKPIHNAITSYLVKLSSKKVILKYSNIVSKEKAKKALEENSKALKTYIKMVKMLLSFTKLNEGEPQSWKNDYFKLCSGKQMFFTDAEMEKEWDYFISQIR